MTNTVSQLRQTFLDYFKSKEHTNVLSAPLVPANDSTLLFVNAGMVPFKETFLGLEQRNYTKATSCQRCIRAGGKHNDLENVGYTARHHTFFEMLGNFSFGDYFKRDAIFFAWKFLTDVLKLPADKLWITVYEQDDEAAYIWLKEIKIDPARFSRCGEKDNFWSMGDTGPCGPCSEIFYDHGPKIAGGPPGSSDEEGDRYIEIWNLVFMQYNRDTQGQLTPLPKPSVDTGMGLERLAAVMQGVHSNYEIDLFQSLIKAVADLADCNDLNNNSLRVIADHIRACTFLVMDGIVPSNEGRGYVLRRIIRRAIRHGHKLGLYEPFFYRLVNTLDEEMGTAYPELSKNKALIERILKQEEERFDETLDRGMRLLEQVIADLPDNIIPGKTIFKLYDTYGFPTDLTGDIARERGLTLDMVGFDQEMAKQRARSGADNQFNVDYSEQAQSTDYQSEFTGYENVQDESIVTALFYEGDSVESLSMGQQGQVILEHTPFYAESGGQVGDKGLLVQSDAVFEVEDTKKKGKAHIHLGKLTAGTIQIGDKLQAKIDIPARQSIARNHTATHLMHAALQQILGEHVKQKGSLVDSERLRFDFSHFEPVISEQLTQIERLVNQQILHNTQVQTRILALEEAMNSGAMALFGEKYEEQVRVLSIGDFSTELCGGTHVHYAGDIGLFKIVAETGTAAGIRRIEAITGNRALDWVTDTDNTLNKIMSLLKTKRESLETRVVQLFEQNRHLEKENSKLQEKIALSKGNDLANQAIDINGIKVLAAQLDKMDKKQLRSTLDQLKNKLKTAVIILATVQGDKILLIAGVTENTTDKIKAGDLMKHVAQQIGGKGGGRPDMAQGGGNDPSKLKEALESVMEWVKSHQVQVPSLIKEGI
ncbi:alanine--tRNA ligase [Candidatus Parabeggiatoa sp. HSG14]|uniref:alanine--tRNA ligase n=1 Tax=Candidatus Parabeggiatoa sp. HSG14 TaxID=3055593 RepID=UPI0025A906B1|nr:alanine--tRNA ligase [Thiotrichales bacterium HSG14]